MEGGIFLLGQDKRLVKMTEQPYAAEELLQRLLAGEQINAASPRHWLLVEREIGIPSESGGADQWALDHLFLDQDAIPTFVEVKRGSDTRIRREVVGQMLDYAANAITYWPVERIRAQFDAACALRGDDPSIELEEFLGPDTNAEGFWDQAGLNLQAGRVRLLFVADLVPAPLRRIVEFLNQQMNPAEVLAVEIRQVVGESNGQTLQTLVPRVIGQTEAANQRRVPTVPLNPVHSLDDFLATVVADIRPAAASILTLLAGAGYGPTPYNTRLGYPTVRIQAPNVPLAPFTLDPKMLWVSLGRDSPLLKVPNVNAALRRLLDRAAPGLKSVSNPKKSQVGVPLHRLASPASLAAMDELFALVRETLQQPKLTSHAE